MVYVIKIDKTRCNRSAPWLSTTGMIPASVSGRGMCGKNAACAMANKPRGEVWHFGRWNWGDRAGMCWPIFSMLHEVKEYLNICTNVYIYIISWNIYTIYTIANVRRLYDHYGWIMVVYFSVGFVVFAIWFWCSKHGNHWTTGVALHARPGMEGPEGWRDGESQQVAERFIKRLNTC